MSEVSLCLLFFIVFYFLFKYKSLSLEQYFIKQLKNMLLDEKNLNKLINSQGLDLISVKLDLLFVIEYFKSNKFNKISIEPKEIQDKIQIIFLLHSEYEILKVQGYFKNKKVFLNNIG